MNQVQIPLSSIKALKNIYEQQDNNPFASSDFFESQFEIFQLVAKESGITLNKPAIAPHDLDWLAYLEVLAHKNALRVRQVTLKENWWKHDSGALIGIYKNKSCALLRRHDGYELVDSRSGAHQKINANLARKIQPIAYMFYPSFPDGPFSLSSLIQFTFSSLKNEMVLAVIFQLLASLLLLAIPILSGTLFEYVIPTANYSLLTQYTFFLLAIGVLVSILRFVQMLFVVRIRLKAQHKIQVAIWDRLLKLPLGFFKEYTAGDLSFRCSTVTVIQEALGQNIITTIISGFLSVTNLALMFYIDIYLALAGTLMVFLLAIISFAFDFLLLKKQRKIIVQKTKINGLLLNLVHAISKIRMSNRSTPAFGLWTNEFSNKMKAQISSNKYLNCLNFLDLGFVGLSTIVIYSLVVWRGATINFGQFIVFNAAFIQLYSSVLALSQCINESIEIIPLVKMFQPILECRVENNQDKHSVIIDGYIAIEQLVFRYPGTEKPLFLNLNMTVKPGDYIAIVGPSGAGKSSFFRLLLGLEHAESGSISYNGINLEHIHLQDLRKQMGIVMQSTQLIPGTLFENICGRNREMTREEAWDVAENIGLADLIHNLPMGMDTLINDGIQTFSGGEIQRINLARAISSRPKILLLDEATSALDNRVQFKIQNFLQELKITRIVIAHRFSTIMHADIIHVINNGTIVESGSYKELLAHKELFYELSLHQTC